jgi:hypothetical protein
LKKALAESAVAQGTSADAKNKQITVIDTGSVCVLAIVY